MTQLESFKLFIQSFEPDYSPSEEVLQNAKIKSSIYLKKLEFYLDHDEYCLLYFNAWLHYCIVNDRDSALYRKYDIDSKDVLVSSTSNSGSSASMEVPKALSEGSLLAYDLYRTPYGRFVLNILEGLSDIAIVIL